MQAAPQLTAYLLIRSVVIISYYIIYLFQCIIYQLFTYYYSQKLLSIANH